MKDIRTRREASKGWWIETRSIIPCALPADGLIVVFERAAAEGIMDAKYWHKGEGDNKIWYFNETLDREIAEIDVEGRISANPQVLWNLFMYKEKAK